MGLIPQEAIDQVLDRTDIVEIVAAYVPLKKAGRNFKALSPFTTEKTPSFVVSPEKQIFHCFSSGVGGNVVTFIMKQERMDFPEAIRFLAQKVGVTIAEERNKDSSADNIRFQIYRVNELAAQYFQNSLINDKSKGCEEARCYLKNRGIDLDAVKQFQLGYATDAWEGLIGHLRSEGISLTLMEKAGLIIARDKDKGCYDRFRNRIMFPIFDTRGHCRAFGGRAMDNNPAKYINSPETLVYTKGHHLYGFNLAKHAIGQEDEVVIVEGYTDCLVPYQAGVGNIVASLGTALTLEQIRLLRRYTKNVVMLFDMDKAGEAAMLRSLDLLIEEGLDVKVGQLEQGQDPDSFVRQFGAEELQKNIKDSKSFFDFKLKVLASSFDPKSVEGKAKISAEMLATIRKFDNAVLRSGYIKRLAQVLMISEEALIVEIKKVDGKSQDYKTNDSQLRQEKTKKQVRAVEKNILRLLLEEESFIGSTKDLIEIDDFQDGQIRDVISKIYELFDQGKEVNHGNLINSFNDESTVRMISRILTEEETMIGDKQKIYHDCINRLKMDRDKSLRQELLVQIHEAETSGDLEKLEELKMKFNQLIKG